MELNQEQLREAFADMVLPVAFLDRLGTGSDRIPVALSLRQHGQRQDQHRERVLRIYRDPVVVPYAIEVDGNIISILDPNVHRLVRFPGDTLDPRWVVCQRQTALSTRRQVFGVGGNPQQRSRQLDHGGLRDWPGFDSGKSQ
ncbi:MAG: hypothetical protein ABI693_07090 [Bryobacteraceae bacterium]